MVLQSRGLSRRIPSRLRTRVHLADTANIKIVSGEEQMIAFDQEYGADWKIGDDFTARRIDWPRLAKEYDGVIIAPYVWELRLGMGGKIIDGRWIKDARSRISDWYYPWDVASGCIWNGKRAIRAFDVIEQEQEEAA